MNEANGNENENENAPASLLTVAEAAERLQVTIPRLRRMLTRPDFACHVRQQERRTKTGTRTSTVVPESVLVFLQAAFESGEAVFSQEESEQEREQKQEQNGNENALLSALQSEILFLRSQAESHTQEIARRDVAESELRRLLLSDRHEITQLRQQLALAAAPLDVQEASPGDTEGAGDRPEGDTGNHPQEAPDAVQSQPEPRRRAWWEVWRR